MADSTSKPADFKSGASISEKDKWNVGRVFWGLLFIVIGGLVLVSNFGVTTVNWMNVWRLWPRGLIAAGVSILSLRSMLWRILIIILMISTLALVIFVAVGKNPQVQTLQQHSTDAIVKQASPTINKTEVNIKTGLSDLQVTTADQDAIASVKLKSNRASLTQSSVRDGNTQRISFSSEIGGGAWTDAIKSSWDMKLTRNLPLDLNIDTGASNANIDVSRAQLQSMNITTGASSFTLKLGNHKGMVKINLNAGASSVTIRVPGNSGVHLALDNRLSSKQIADLVEVSKDTYESPNYHEATDKIELTGKIGVSSFTIERY